LKQGDLCLGYVTNISKSGCFIKLGSGVVARAGLNELSDQEVKSFKEEYPVGSTVLGRIYKVEEVKGEKRYHMSLRESVVVYGIEAIGAKLTVGQQIEVVVVAKSADKTFGQVKGGTFRLKLTGADKIPIGALAEASVDKVEKGKANATVLKVLTDHHSEQEQFLKNLYASVAEVNS